MLDGENHLDKVGTSLRVVTLEDTQHMDCFHLMIGYKVLMDNGGHWLMIMDIQMNIGLKILMTMVFKILVNLVVMNGLMKRVN